MPSSDKNRSRGESCKGDTNAIVSEVKKILNHIERQESDTIETRLIDRLEHIEQKLRKLERMLESSRLPNSSFNINELIEKIVMARINADQETSMQALKTVCTQLIDGDAGNAQEGQPIGRPATATNGGQKSENGNGVKIVSLPEEAREKLSRREQDIVLQLLQGKSNREISQKLVISEKTVKNNLWKIYRKFNVDSRNKLFYLLLRKDFSHLV